MQDVNDNTVPFNAVVLALYMKKRKFCNPLKGEQAEMSPFF